jgi:ATP phosphoribosyltransferase
VTIALSKGRILKQTLPLLKKAGLEIADKELNSRKLILDTNLDEVKIIGQGDKHAQSWWCL